MTLIMRQPIIDQDRQAAFIDNDCMIVQCPDCLRALFPIDGYYTCVCGFKSESGVLHTEDKSK